MSCSRNFPLNVKNNIFRVCSCSLGRERYQWHRTEEKSESSVDMDIVERATRTKIAIDGSRLRMFR